MRTRSVGGVPRSGAVLAAGALALSGCAGVGGDRIIYSPDELRIELVRRGAAGAPEAAVVPFEIGPELSARAVAITRRHRDASRRVRALIASLSDPEGFGLVYDPAATNDAERTVAAGRGNCLSLASVFIGLARAAGLPAYYADASGRLGEYRRERRLAVSSGHIAAAVRTEAGLALIDFAGELRRFGHFRIIDDVEAAAHFHNNRGYELIHDAHAERRAVPWEDVVRHFQLATRVAPDFARGHNNLGVAYARMGRDTDAADAYRAAIAADPELAAPFHNLASLHRRAGDLEAAKRALAVAADLDPRNPFVRRDQGIVLFERGELRAAAEALERAIELGGDDAESRRLLSHVYRALGRLEEARAGERPASEPG